MDQALSAARSSRAPTSTVATSKPNKQKSQKNAKLSKTTLQPTTTTATSLSTPLTATRKRTFTSLTTSPTPTNHVVGTSHDIEKDYYRLTIAPDPSNVRPLPILKKALDNVKQKWLDNHDYQYACTQLKSIRQDLVVQHVKDDFVVSVYECHGRIALESGDFDEYAQCQNQLNQLYEEGYKGHVDEFGAYAILHACHAGRHCHLDTITMIQNIQRQQQQQLPTKQRKLSASLSSPRGLIISPRASQTSSPKHITRSMTPHDPSPCITHALAVRHALITRNYHIFFKLYQTAPNMSSYLMDRTCDIQRKRALRVMAASYRPTITVQHAMDVLAFDTLDDTMEFLASQNAVSTTNDDELLIDMKATHTALQAQDIKERQEAEAAQARGVTEETKTLGWTGQPGSNITVTTKKRKKPSIAQIEAQYNQLQYAATSDDYDPETRVLIQNQMKKNKQHLKNKKKKKNQNR